MRSERRVLVLVEMRGDGRRVEQRVVDAEEVLLGFAVRVLGQRRNR